MVPQQSPDVSQSRKTSGEKSLMTASVERKDKRTHSSVGLMLLARTAIKLNPQARLPDVGLFRRQRK